MAKKQDKQQPPQPAAQPGPDATPPPPPAAVAPAPDRPVTNGQLLAFWGVVALMVAAARLLDHFMPGTPERVVERWLMLPFGLFLAVFLYKLK